MAALSYGVSVRTDIIQRTFLRQKYIQNFLETDTYSIADNTDRQ